MTTFAAPNRARSVAQSLNGIEPDVYREMRARILNGRERQIGGLLPLTSCVHGCPGKDNIGLAQQLPHRRWIEMKCDVGEIARRVAPFIAGVTAEDQAKKLALGELRLCTQAG